MAFNTRIQYEGSAKGQGFSPVQIPDITPLLRENMDVELSNIKRRGDQELAAQKATAEMLASKMAADEKTKLADLAKFSQTLQEAMVGFAEQQKESAKDEAINLYYLDSQNFSQEEMDQFNAEEKQLSDIDDKVTTAASKGIQKGAPYSAADRLKSLSGWKAYYYAQQMAQEAIAGRPGWISQRMATDNETQITIAGRGTFTPAQAVTPAEKAAARAQLNAQYERATGLDGINNRFKNARVYPEFRKQDSKQDAQWDNQYNSDLSAQERDRLVSQLRTDLNIAKFLDGTNATVDDKQQPWGYPRAWDSLDKASKSLIDQGVITEVDQLYSMFNVPIKGRKGKTYLSEYSHRLQPLIDHLRARKVQVARDLAFVKGENIKAAEAGYLQRFNEGGLTETEIQNLDAQHVSQFGVKSKFLSDVSNGLSIDDYQEGNLNKEAERRALAHVLTPAYVQTLPTIALQQRWMPIAQQQYKESFETNKFETAKKAFKGLVNVYIKPTPDGTSSFEGAYLYQGLMNQFRTEYDIVKATPGVSAPEAEKEAANRVKLMFEQATKDSTSPYYRGPDAANPFPNLFGTTKAVKESFAKHRAHIANIYRNMNDATTREDFIKKENSILTKEQLKAAAKGFGTPSWRVHPLIGMVAETYRMNPLNLFNMLLDANQLDKLQVPEVRGLDQLTHSQRNKLLTHHSTNRSMQAGASAGVYINRYFSDDVSNIVVDAATSAGNNPSLMAGLAMKESSGRTGVQNSIGATGLYQILLSAHPNVSYQQATDPKFSAKYANDLLKQYTQEAGGNILGGLARYGGYGNGQAAIDAAMEPYIKPIIRYAAEFGYKGPLLQYLRRYPPVKPAYN